MKQKKYAFKIDGPGKYVTANHPVVEISGYVEGHEYCWHSYFYGFYSDDGYPSPDCPTVFGDISIIGKIKILPSKVAKTNRPSKRQPTREQKNVFWVNEYKGGQYGCMYDSEEEAIQFASQDAVRVAVRFVEQPE